MDNEVNDTLCRFVVLCCGGREGSKYIEMTGEIKIRQGSDLCPMRHCTVDCPRLQRIEIELYQISY